jgi:hypothetical protein
MAPAPNLDLTGKLVKRGLFVSWHCFRGVVCRVRSGRCLILFNGHLYSNWLPCNSVQVVARLPSDNWLQHRSDRVLKA